MVDVHNPKAQDMFYFCNVSSGGAATKVIGRSQTLSVEVSINTVLSFTVYECPEPVFTPETARCLGLLRVPVERLAERYSSGIFQQWFNLDTKTDPRMPAGDLQALISRFEQAYSDAVSPGFLLAMSRKVRFWWVCIYIYYIYIYIICVFMCVCFVLGYASFRGY